MLNSSVGATGEWLSAGGKMASCKRCTVSAEAPSVGKLSTFLSPTCRLPQKSAKRVFYFFVID